MFQTDVATAVSSLPAPSAPGTPGYFSNGDPVHGVPRTTLDADYMNMLMLEIINVIVAGGETPSKSNYTQLLTAINNLVNGDVPNATTATAGKAKLATQSLVDAGSDASTIVTPGTLAHGFSLSINGTSFRIVLPSWLGSLVIQGMQTPPWANSDGPKTTNWPAPFPNACFIPVSVVVNPSGDTSGTWDVDSQVCSYDTNGITLLTQFTNSSAHNTAAAHLVLAIGR